MARSYIRSDSGAVLAASMLIAPGKQQAASSDTRPWMA